MTCFELELADLDEYVEIRWHQDVPLVFSMFHSWALLAPGLAFGKIRQLPEAVVHVDAHHDLSASLLDSISPGRLTNDVLCAKCHLDDPDSIDLAINARWINKANFLTAYLLATPTARLIHVDPDCVPHEFFVRSVAEPIQIGVACTTQSSLRFEREKSENAWHLQEMPTLPADLSLSPHHKVWLDVDLDAFCNRFDGDSDNAARVATSTEFRALEARMNGFLRELSQVRWLTSIGAVSVAASPGFFPSEYWEYTIPATCEGIVGLLRP